MMASSRLQFEKERELAQMIRSAAPGDRPRAYHEAYKQLYQLFPDIATNEAEESNRVFTTMSFLEGFVGSAEVACEVGAGRCLLARALAKRFTRVIALDVAPLTDAVNWPSNLQHVVFDGMRIDAAASSADLVVSDNVLEHVHPDDALPELREMLRVLKPRGYIAILTPNKVNGPHDVSADFSREPEGLHLKEYSSLGMKKLLREAGCVSVRAYIGFNGRYVSMLPEVGALIEFVACSLPRRFLRLRKIRWILPNRYTARKASSSLLPRQGHHDGA
jgi:SAM-dependent methyltransferase